MLVDYLSTVAVPWCGVRKAMESAKQKSLLVFLIKKKAPKVLMDPAEIVKVLVAHDDILWLRQVIILCLRRNVVNLLVPMEHARAQVQ